MLKSILFLVLALIAAFAAYVALLPATSTISRSATLAAPPAVVFPHINDLHKWQAWSPWAKIDPGAKTSFEGPDAGKGAVFHWSGNREVGEGTMTIIESTPSDRVKIRLDFVKPFASTSVAELSLKPEGNGTNVTWTMTGERPFLARAMCLAFNADKMVGEMFDKGLASLNDVASAKK